MGQVCYSVAMKKNEEYTLECTGLSDQGYGIGHIGGMTVFAANLLPGEKARVRIIKPASRYAIARVMERFSDSPIRTEPRCPYAAQCGGCSFQHVKYEDQLLWKHQQLDHLFSVLDPAPEVLPVLGMEDPYYYRNKAQFPIQVRDGKIISGFYRPRTNTIVDVEDCAIQSERINEVYRWIRANLPVSVAEDLRHLFIRDSEKLHQMQVVFIGRWNPRLEGFVRRLVKVFPEIVSVVFNENLREDNVILGEKYRVLYGSDSLEEDCLGLTISLHFKSFFQVNPAQMEVLYSTALKMADLKKTDRVVELYSGTGTIGLLASRQAAEVTGVEIVPEAVENARENARINHIRNAQFVCQDASDFAAGFHGQADVLIVDPPRKGLSVQGIENIVRIHPERLVYISCNPRTLQRDLQLLQKDGYLCSRIQPVDMFSHTSGIECIALLHPCSACGQTEKPERSAQKEEQ